MIATDLDGTLIAGNSFPMFLRFVIRRASFFDTIKLLGAASLRKIGLMSHLRLKWILTHIANRCMSDADYHEFCNQLIGILNADLMERIKGKETVIVSAACEEYVIPLARKLNMWCIATPNAAKFADYCENRGEDKVRRLEKEFPNVTIEEAYTDSLEDEPLLEYARKGYLVDAQRRIFKEWAPSGNSPSMTNAR